MSAERAGLAAARASATRSARVSTARPGCERVFVSPLAVGVTPASIALRSVLAATRSASGAMTPAA
jgi:hypothetical protein